MRSTHLNPMLKSALLGLFAIIVVACDSAPDRIIACPSIRIPLDTERVTRFADGTGRDITDIVLEGQIKFLSGECTVEENQIEMTFPIAIRGVRGAAERAGRQDIDVFLAVSTLDRTILMRREIPMTLRFEGNKTAIVTSDIVTIAIPKRADQAATDFILFMGLVLSPEELTYNREESRR